MRLTSTRRYFIGGSDARIVMGDDEAALLRLWREKRGEVEPEDLSGNLIVQLGSATEELNRRWYQANTGRVVTDIQKRVRHPALRWMAATVDGRVEATGAVFEAKFRLPWAFSEEAAAEKYMPQLQHNMWVIAARSAVLSVITGGGKWVEITTHADPLYQHLIVTAERKFWRCVESGEALASNKSAVFGIFRMAEILRNRRSFRGPSSRAAIAQLATPCGVRSGRQTECVFAANGISGILLKARFLPWHQSRS